MRRLKRLQLLPGGGLLEPRSTETFRLVDLSFVLSEAEERKKDQEEGSQDEEVAEETAAEHDEGVDGLLLLQFVVQEAAYGRKERECQEE